MDPADNAVVCNAAQRVARTGVKLQGMAPTGSAAAAVGNRVGRRQNVSDNGDNYNQIQIEEVIDSKNNDHHEFPDIMGR